MVLKTTTIDAEIADVDTRLAALEIKIEKVSKTLRNYQKKKARLMDMSLRLGVSKLHVEKFNALDAKV